MRVHTGTGRQQLKAAKTKMTMKAQAPQADGSSSGGGSGGSSGRERRRKIMRQRTVN